jgi:hypothetical protein
VVCAACRRKANIHAPFHGISAEKTLCLLFCGEQLRGGNIDVFDCGRQAMHKVSSLTVAHLADGTMANASLQMPQSLIPWAFAVYATGQPRGQRL